MPSPEPSLRKFGDNVRARREAQDLSSASTLSPPNGQEQLAERADLDRVYISDVHHVHFGQM